MAKQKEDDSAAGFAREASHRQAGFIREFGGYLLANKKWWLTPVIILLLLLGVVVMVGGTPAAPFIYTLF